MSLASVWPLSWGSIPRTALPPYLLAHGCLSRIRCSTLAEHLLCTCQRLAAAQRFPGPRSFPFLSLTLAIFPLPLIFKNVFIFNSFIEMQSISHTRFTHFKYTI